MGLFEWLPWILFPLFGFLALRGYRRQRQLVKAWAVSNNVTLIRRLPSWYRLSPFVFAAFGKHRIEFWLVRDAVGIERRVWLKLGNFMLGSLLAEITEEWEP